MRALAGTLAILGVGVVFSFSGWPMQATGAEGERLARQREQEGDSNRERPAGSPARLPEIRTSVVPMKDAAAHRGDWGVMRPYFRGETEATRNVFVATATIEPGQAIHHAHRHVEEEYLLITAGRGTWHLDGREFPAETGDMLFVEPWVYHGIRNTGTEPLEFVVFKYAGKGVPAPERPDDGKEDTLKR